MTFLKIFFFSAILFSSSYGAEKEATQVDISYDNIRTSTFKSNSQASALNVAFKNVSCPNRLIRFIDKPVCSELKTNMETIMWECLVIYSCTDY